MTTLPELEKRILGWLDNLAELTRSGDDRITTEKLAIYASMLAKDRFPTAAFTTDSLHHVAEDLRFFPAYADVRSKLQAWWNEHKPHIAPAIAGPQSEANLTVEDRQWLDYFRKRESEKFAVMRAGDAPSSRERVLSLVKQQSLAAWRILVGNEEPVGQYPTAEAIAYVARLLHPEPVQQPGAAPEPEPTPEPRPKPLHPPPEVLAAMRKARGITPIPPPADVIPIRPVP